MIEHDILTTRSFYMLPLRRNNDPNLKNREYDIIWFTGLKTKCLWIFLCIFPFAKIYFHLEWKGVGGKNNYTVIFIRIEKQIHYYINLDTS